MKIGIFSPYLDSLGGGEKYILTLALCLLENNNVSLFWNPSQASEIKKNAEKKFGFDLSTVSFTNNIFSPTISLMTRVLQARKYDRIIYLSDGSLPFLLGKKIIVHFQFPVEWVNGKNIKTRIKKLVGIKDVICNSLFTQTYIDKTFNVKSLLVYPPVEMIEQGAINKENIILNVGRFGNYGRGSSFKRQDFLAEAFEKMVKNGLSDWKLVFVVSTRKEDEPSLQRFMQKTGKLPIEFVQNPNNETLKRFYKKAKIYWHAAGYGQDLQKHPERAEHFGIATVEAMSAGAVPIVIAAGGQKEIVEHNKNGFLWETQDELISNTWSVIKDDKIFQKLSSEAIMRANHFSVDIFCKKVNDILS